MLISVVVPFSRPDCLRRTLDNFARQRHPDKRLVLVENGEAIGACARAGVTGATVLESAPHLSHAKNLGIEWVRAHGGGFWTTFDDDDHYGAGYLELVAQGATRAGVVGAPRHYVRLADGLHLFNYDRGRGPFSGQCFHGATLGAWAEESVEFPVVALGEEAGFCAAMLVAGARLWSVGPGEYVYRRSGDSHVWRATDVQVRRATGPSWRNGKLLRTPSDAEVFADQLRLLSPRAA